jgi:LysM repeat protein
MMKKWIVLIAVLSLVLTASALAQAPEGQEYTVKAGDELNKIAAEYLGDATKYQEIVDATNLKVEEDSSFTIITDPHLIEVGQKLWIPVEATATAVSTAAPAEEAAPETAEASVEEVSKTEVVYYVPEVPKTTQDGSCWTTSISTPTGWRCTVDNSIYDPCLVGTDGKTVVCGLTGTDEEPFALNLTEPLPAPDIPEGAQAMPYRLDLANGATCNFATGTVTPVGDDIVQYYCSDKYGVLSDIKKGTVWEATEVLTGDMSAEGKVEVKDSRTMAVAKVWYGPEEESDKKTAETDQTPTPEASTS